MKALEILVVEDEPSNREIAEVILSSLGHRVTTCDNGQRAIELCLQANPPFDMVLMDILTPVMDGLEATRVLRDNPLTHGLPIICVSAKASGSDEAAGIAAGCDAYLKKPYRRRELLACIDDVLVSRGIIAPGESMFKG
ncbi:MAG: response regulator [Cyanobacteria bacterium REEB65]|nr:response regulator [Cyanobacteria bacterium REEB65]